MPQGTLQVSAPINARGDGTCLFGGGLGRTYIEQQTSNVAVLKVGGKGCRYNGFGLGYASVQTSAQTSANAIESLNLWMSQISNMVIVNCGRGLWCPTAEGSNYFFSNFCFNWDVYLPSISGIYIKPTSTGNTPTKFTNVHIVADLGGGTVGTLSEPAVYLESSNVVFDVLNVEWLRCTNTSGLGLGVIKVRDSIATFNSLYMEGAQSAIDGGAFLECLGPTGGSNVVVNGWNVNNALVVDAPVSTHAYLKINDANTKVTINGFVDGSNVTTGTFFTFLNGASAAGQQVRLTDFGTPDTDGWNQMTGSPPATIIQQPTYANVT